MILFLSTFYDVGTIFTKIIELTHSTIFCSQMYERNQTIKELNCQILPIYIHIISWFDQKMYYNIL